jgi:naphthalene 1,2-dioxygenase ferredoxin component
VAARGNPGRQLSAKLSHCVEGEVFATDNLCTHGHARLCEGLLLGHEFECRLHQGRFDVRTGAATFEPAQEALRGCPVKIDGGRVYIALG